MRQGRFAALLYMCVRVLKTGIPLTAGATWNCSLCGDARLTMAKLHSVHFISSHLGFVAGKGPRTTRRTLSTRCPLQHAAAQSNLKNTALMRTNTGDNGTVLKTVNQGLNWTLCTTAKTAAHSLDLFGIFMHQPLVVFAVGDPFSLQPLLGTARHALIIDAQCKRRSARASPKNPRRRLHLDSSTRRH